MGLANCKHLKACDKYFENLLANSADLLLLGNIELTHDEINHLTRLISMEIQKPFPEVSDSLTVAVFLVWMGILHYHEGNFWAPVYKALGLPYGQVKWQRILGETFLQVLEKYKLPKFKDKLRYITPILAHGYVPNSYLNNYFNDVVLAIYKEREKAGLSVKLEETKHLVVNWRRAYFAYQKREKRLIELENQENSLLLGLDVWKNRNRLERLRDLEGQIIESAELTALLSFPEGWLEQTEAERDHLQRQMEKFNEILRNRKAWETERNQLNQKVETVARKMLDHWDDNIADSVLALSIDEVKKLVEDFITANRIFTGFWGWLTRLFLRRRYHRVMEYRRRLEQKFSVLPFRNDLLAKPGPELSRGLLELQQILMQRRNVENLLEELSKSEQEIAADSQVETVSSDILSLWQKQLSKLNKEIAAYKMNLVRLGKGKLEVGLDELSQQRSLRREIETIKGEVSCEHSIDILMQNLSLVEKYRNEQYIRDHLVEIRKQKKECFERLKAGNNPLYSLNESTRTFIFQGKELAEQFIFNSLLLMQKLDQGDDEIDSIVLPSRIIQCMKKWWQEQGKETLAAVQQVREWSRGGAALTFHRPIVRLDVCERSIKVELPQQALKDVGKIEFTVQTEAGTVGKTDVPIKKIEDGQYRTDTVFLNLEQPAPVYNFELCCGEKCYTWQVKGPCADNICLFFSQQGELIESDQLPEKGAYLVAPAGSRFKPAGAVKEKERLEGYWFDYEYCYLDLDGVDMMLVETEREEVIYKRKPQLEPRLAGGDELTGVKADGKAVYRGELPKLVFSIEATEEIGFYGVRFDYTEGSRYVPLESLNIKKSKDNVIFVPLADIAPGVYGLCKAALICRQNIIWTEEFAVVPDLKIKFDREIYPPQEGKKGEIGKLELSSQHCFTVAVQSPAELTESTSFKSLIEFDTREDQINVELRYFMVQRQCSLGISIAIPGVRWREGEAEHWKAEAEEIWYEDLGEVQVRLPPSVSQSVELALAQGRQVITPSIKRGILVFNLRQFSDNLRDCTLVAQDLFLSFREESIPSCLLVRVRLRWQVVEIDLEQKQEGKKRVVVIKWEDLGRVSNRVVRLWPLNMPGVKMIERAVPDEISIVEIAEPVERLPAGRYRLQFAVDDPWNEVEIMLPEADSENCKDILIGDKEELLLDVLGNGLKIAAFECDGENIPAEREYWIQDIEMRSEFEGEERFQGNVYTLDQEGKTVALDYNPVSFYLDLDTDNINRLPFLVDRDRDGATYCRKCRVLFWEVAHRECGNQVILPEYILVVVRRDKDGIRSPESD